MIETQPLRVVLVHWSRLTLNSQVVLWTLYKSWLTPTMGSMYKLLVKHIGFMLIQAVVGLKQL